MRITGTLIILVAALLSAVALADETNTTAMQPLWTRTATIGATITRGNSKTILTSGSILAERKGINTEIRLGAEANFGQAEVTGTNGATFNDTNVNNAKMFAELKKSLSLMTYFYSKADALTDRIAGLDYRIIIGPGVGFYLLKDERQALSADIGISYIHEEPSTDSENIAALRARERYDLKISPAAKLWQSAEYLPALNDFSRFLMNAELGIETAINTRLSLRAVIQDKYNSDAPEGKEKNDVIMITGIGVKF